jgi:hypothetical protein
MKINMEDKKEIFFGLYNDEEVLMKAVKQAKHDHLEIMDVFTPFPVHGLDKELGLSESRLHIAGFFYGAIGALLAFMFMTWVFTRDWPIIFGGKPYWSVPAFIPITFEVTVLFASVGMVITFFTVNGLSPGMEPMVLHPRITDDKFCIAFDTTNATAEVKGLIQSFFEQTGAEQTEVKSV